MARYWYSGDLFEGETLTLSINDPGLLYGATVFTTMRVYGSSLDHPLTQWQAHCDRLRTSLKKLGWTEPDWERLRKGTNQLIPHFPVLRITVFPDGREWIMGRSLPAELQQRQQNGVTAWVADPELGRSLSADKTGNYLAPWLARQQGLQQDAQEAILVDQVGHWLETSTGNLWGWRAGCWWTPPLTSNILPGLIRARLLRNLKNLGYPCQVLPWPGGQMAQFEALAYTNSVVEIIPIHTVSQIDQQLRYNPKHPGLEILRASFSTGADPDL